MAAGRLGEFGYWGFVNVGGKQVRSDADRGWPLRFQSVQAAYGAGSLSPIKALHRCNAAADGAVSSRRFSIARQAMGRRPCRSHAPWAMLGQSPLRRQTDQHIYLEKLRPEPISLCRLIKLKNVDAPPLSFVIAPKNPHPCVSPKANALGQQRFSRGE